MSRVIVRDEVDAAELIRSVVWLKVLDQAAVPAELPNWTLSPSRIVLLVQGRFHQTQLRLHVLTPVQVQQAPIVARQPVAWIELHGHLVPLLGECEQSGFAFQSPVLIGKRIQENADRSC